MTKTLDASLGMHILEVEITTRCNLDCKHCYNRNYKNIDLPVEKFKEFYNFANENNVWTLIVSGGEAILHQRFNEIISFVKKTPHKFRLVLQTNGLLIDDNIIKKIKVFDIIHISFDLTEDVRKGGARNLKLAKKLVAKGINCYLFVTIHKKNKHLLEEVVVMANKAKVPIGFNICIPVDKLDKSYIMSKEEFMGIEKKLFAFHQNGKILRYSNPLVALLDPKKRGKKSRIRGGCSAGVAACVINPLGELLPCPFLRRSAGNVFQASLKKLWINSELFEKIRARKKFKEPCGSCDYLSFCGGCRNRALVQTGDIQGADPMCYKEIL